MCFACRAGTRASASRGRFSPPSSLKNSTALPSPTTFTMTFDPNAIALSVAAGAAAGLVGCFAVMRRMTLAADAISHIALPGIGVAILLRIHPILGGVAALLVGTLLVWGIENRTRLATETIIGVVFSTALAIGSLITSGDDLIEALFGGVGHLTGVEVSLGLVLAIVVIAFMVWQ